jgi:hypothetical protein
MQLPNLRTLANALANLPADVAQTYIRVRELQRLVEELRHQVLRAPAPPPPPFVAVLVQGRGPNGSTTLGMAKELTVKAGDMLELQSQLPLWDVTVTVFCDLRRVRVGGIFCGVDLMHAAMGSCPVAHVSKWELGVWLRVQATAVEE